MPTQVIEVEPATVPNDASWTGGDESCSHDDADVAGKTVVCRDCGASAVGAHLPDEYTTSGPHGRSIPR